MPRSLLRDVRRTTLRLFGILGTRALVAVCLIWAVSVAIGAWRDLWSEASGVTVEGLVIRQDEVVAGPTLESDLPPGVSPEPGAQTRRFRAVIEFKEQGRTFRVRAQRISTTQLYPIDSTPVLVFPPGRPELARLRDELPDPLGQSAALLMAVLMAAGALRWWRWLARRRPRLLRRKAKDSAPVRAASPESEAADPVDVEPTEPPANG